MVTRTIVTVPRSLMRVTGSDWDIDWREKGAREANDGSMQTVVSAAPRWIASIPLRLTPDAVRGWRAIRDEARGRTGLYRLPIVDPVGLDIGTAARRGLPFSTGQRFGTGEGFEYRPTAEVATDAEQGARTLILRAVDLPHDLRPGMFLSHDDWPVRITSHSAGEDEGGPTVELTVAPFLRAAIPAGALVEMNAHGIFEVTDGSGNPGYDLSRTSSTVLNVREWLNR